MKMEFNVINMQKYTKWIEQTKMNAVMFIKNKI